MHCNQQCVLPLTQPSHNELCAWRGSTCWAASPVKWLQKDYPLIWYQNEKLLCTQNSMKTAAEHTFDISETSMSLHNNSSAFSCKEATNRTNCFIALLLRLWSWDRTVGLAWGREMQSQASAWNYIYLLFSNTPADFMHMEVWEAQLYRTWKG